jgi:hypothetical protein
MWQVVFFFFLFVFLDHSTCIHYSSAFLRTHSQLNSLGQLGPKPSGSSDVWFYPRVASE